MKKMSRSPAAIRNGFTPPLAAPNYFGSSPAPSIPPPTVLNPRNFVAASSLSSPPLPQIPPPQRIPLPRNRKSHALIKYRNQKAIIMRANKRRPLSRPQACRYKSQIFVSSFCRGNIAEAASAVSRLSNFHFHFSNFRFSRVSVRDSGGLPIPCSVAAPFRASAPPARQSFPAAVLHRAAVCHHSSCELQPAAVRRFPKSR